MVQGLYRGFAFECWFSLDKHSVGTTTGKRRISASEPARPNRHLIECIR